jgi:S1-C subfamily serine protease
MLYFFLIFASLNVFANSFIIESKSFDGETSYGHGFFLKDGLILTSYHVVANSDDIKIQTTHKFYNAEILGFDEVRDIALLQSDVLLPKFYNISQCEKNDSGIVLHSSGSIFGKVIAEDEINLIINANVKRGHSGSPFIANEKVCGVLTGFAKNTGNAIVAKISDDLILKFKQGMKLKRKDLKIYVANLTKENARLLNFDLKNIPKGVLVTNSENKEIKEWEVITKINEKSTPTVDEFLEVVSKIYENDEVRIEKFSNI